jgi:hypothetical protein
MSVGEDCGWLDVSHRAPCARALPDHAQDARALGAGRRIWWLHAIRDRCPALSISPGSGGEELKVGSSRRSVNVRTG